jgi:WD40 repeat protein
MAFSPDGQRLVSGSSDASVRLWDVESGQELLSLPGVVHGVEHVAFSQDGRRIAASTGDRVQFWEAAPTQQEADRRSVEDRP